MLGALVAVLILATMFVFAAYVVMKWTLPPDVVTSVVRFFDRAGTIVLQIALLLVVAFVIWALWIRPQV